MKTTIFTGCQQVLLEALYEAPTGWLRQIDLRKAVQLVDEPQRKASNRVFRTCQELKQRGLIWMEGANAGITKDGSRALALQWSLK